MNYLQAIIMGIVEGITEFLPISSTGHLILTAKFLGVLQTEFVKSFEIVIQLGAILAVVVLYWKTIFFNKAAMIKVLAAFIPTGILGFILYNLIKQYLIGNEVVVIFTLFFGGIGIILFEKYYKKETSISAIEDISYGQAVIIGLAQAVAVIPGVSRSAATIIGGLCLGISRKAIVEFSFLLAVPTMAAATCLDLWKNADSFSSSQAGVLAVGFIVSFLMAVAAIKFLLGFVKKYSFVAFGVYRIVVGIFLILFLI